MKNRSLAASSRYLFLLCLYLSLTGCSHGFHREEMRARLEAQSSYHVAVNDGGPVTAEKIHAAISLRPQLRFPFSLAVYDGGGCGMTAGFKDDFLKSAEVLKDRGVVSRLSYISPILTKSRDLGEVRLAAAKQGADAVFLYNCTTDTDRYLNPFSIFYLTIFGFWIAPGHSIDSLVMLQGAMFDVANEYVYMTVESEGEGSTYAAAAVIEEKPARERAKEKALKSFTSEFVKQVSALR